MNNQEKIDNHSYQLVILIIFLVLLIFNQGWRSIQINRLKQDTTTLRAYNDEVWRVMSGVEDRFQYLEEFHLESKKQEITIAEDALVKAIEDNLEAERNEARFLLDALAERGTNQPNLLGGNQ